MKNISIFLLLVACSVGFTGQSGQSQVTPEKFNVFVHVKCSDEVTKALKVISNENYAF